MRVVPSTTSKGAETERSFRELAERLYVGISEVASPMHELQDPTLIIRSDESVHICKLLVKRSTRLFLAESALDYPMSQFVRDRGRCLVLRRNYVQAIRSGVQSQTTVPNVLEIRKYASYQGDLDFAFRVVLA